MAGQTRIDWCDATHNPVTGCRNGCEYCYASKIAKRFGAHWTTADPDALHVLTEPHRIGIQEGKTRQTPYPFDFEPTFHTYKLDEPTHWKKPRTIFVCSMADLFGAWVPDKWISAVFQAYQKAPQHRYLFLTKNPRRYLDLDNKGMLPASDNMWYGTTITGPGQPFYWSKTHHTFLSIEPMQERFPMQRSVELKNVEWVIVGAETGTRKGKITPTFEWIFELAVTCERYSRPLFMKSSLEKIMKGKPIQKYPWIN